MLNQRVKILCICNQGENRSRTVFDILSANAGYVLKYDGFYKEKFNEASNQMEEFDPRNLEWADKIIVFEVSHEDLLKKFGYQYWSKSYNLDVPDLYSYSQQKLKEIIESKLRQYNFLS